MADSQRRCVTGTAALLLIATLVFAMPASAQSLYKYRGPDGEWIYSDRPPPDGQADETRTLRNSSGGARVTMRTESNGPALQFIAANTLPAPVQIGIRFTRIEGLDFPDPDHELTWVLQPGAEETVLELPRLGVGSVPVARYVFDYRVGDPAAVHQPSRPYRAPFSISNQFPVTQAYPEVVTHRSADARYAVDIAMPIGTDVFAAREGIVFDVSAENYRNGLDPERDGPSANVVQILHDDGTYAVYAHLNWNSIRVRPGDRVARGQYIADSGNTGFSSGPHLHFVVLRNAGMQTVSVPVVFEGKDRTVVTPATGSVLTAY